MIKVGKFARMKGCTPQAVRKRLVELTCKKVDGVLHIVMNKKAERFTVDTTKQHPKEKL